MTTARKVKSNRANARSSTGPKTPKGRGRSAKNALRHRLTLPVDSDPALSQEVAALARQIIGADASPEMQEIARHIAEAQVDLRRIRVLRHDLISRALSNADYDSRTNWDKKLNTALRIIRRCCRCEDVPEEEVKFLFSKLSEPDRFTTIITEIARRLPALDRYERRALSRRKLAIRALDAGGAKLAEAVRRHGTRSGTRASSTAYSDYEEPRVMPVHAVVRWPAQFLRT